MIKKMIMLSVLVLLVTIPALAQALDFTDLDVTIGTVKIPRAFIHAGKEYNKGNYWVTLKAKEGIPYFNVCDQKKELLFEELAVLIPLNAPTPTEKVWQHVTKKMMKDHEYYRIKVMRPDSMIIAYLLIKPTPVAPESTEPPAEPEPEAKPAEEIE